MIVKICRFGVLMDFEEWKEDATFINFNITVNDEQMRIKNNSSVIIDLYKISDPSQKYYFDMNQGQYHKTQVYPKNNNIPQFFNIYTDNELKNEQKTLILNFKKSVANAFIITKVDDNYLFSANQMRTVLSAILTFRQYFMKGKFDYVQNPFYAEGNIFEFPQDIKQSLIYLIKILKPEQNDSNEIHVPNKMTQSLFKYIGLIDILFDILRLPFSSKLFKPEKISEIPEYILVIFNYIYDILIIVVDSNIINAFYCSQWIDLLIDQSLHIIQHDQFEVYPLKIMDFLRALCEQNPKIQEKNIHYQHIDQILNIMKTKKSHHINDLLNLMIRCQNKEIMKNQNYISTFLSLENSLTNLLIPIQTKYEEVEIFIYNEWVPLNEFYSISQKNDELRLWKYFLSLINLVSNLCYEKNYIAVNLFQPIFSFNLCFKILDHSKYKKQFPLLVQAFVNLTNYLWIQSCQHIKHPIPKIIKSIQEITNKHELKDYDPELYMFQPLKDYIDDYLKSLVKQKFIHASQIEKNQLTVSILVLLHEMIKNHFYQESKKIQNVVDYLLVILDGSKDVFNQEEEDYLKIKTTLINQQIESTMTDTTMIKTKKFSSRYLFTNENMVLVQQKILIINILQICLKIKIDYRLKFILNEMIQSKSKDHNQYLQAIEEENDNDQKKLISQSQIQMIELSENNHNPELVQIQSIINKTIAYVPIVIQKNQKKDLECILYDLLLYNNQELNQQAFELLQTIYRQKETLLDYAIEVQLLENEQHHRDHEFLNEIIKNLNSLADQASSFVNSSNAKSVKLQKSLLENIQQLIIFLSEQGNQKKYDIDKDLDTKQLEFFNDSLNIQTQDQKLMRNLCVHEDFIHLLKIMLFNNESDKSKYEQRNGYFNRILKKSFEFLSLFIYKNKINQDLLLPNMDLFLNGMSYGIEEINPQNLVFLMYKDNLNLLKPGNNYHYLQKIIQMTIDEMCKKKYSNPIFSLKLMECLMCVIYLNGVILKKHTVQIVKIISSGQNCDFLIPIDDGLLESIENHESKFRNSLSIHISNDINNFIQQLYFFGQICDGKNQVCETQVSSYFTCGKLIDLLIKSPNNIYLRRSVYFFIYHVYFETNLLQMETQSVFSLSTFLIKDFLKTIQIFKNKADSDFKTVIVQDLQINYNILVKDYLIKVLMPILYYVIKFQKIDYNQIQFEGLNDTLDMESVVLSKLYDLTIGLLSFGEDLQHICIFLQFIVARQKLFGNQRLQSSIIPDDFIDHFKKYQHLEYNDIIVRKPVSELTSIRNDRNQQSKLNAKKESNFMQKIINYQQSDVSLKDNEKELWALVENIINVESISQNINQSFNTLSFNDVIQGVVKIVNVQNNNSEFVILQTFKLFRRIIESQNLSSDKPANEWDDYKDYEKKVIYYQNLLNSFGITQLVAEYIGSNQITPSIMKEGINLLVNHKQKRIQYKKISKKFLVANILINKFLKVIVNDI